jgi:leucyl-tRNA synthetase
VFTGFSALNRLNGRRLPIYVSDFVLGGYGTGAVVGVPGHDRRDFEFAEEYRLPVVRVVAGPDGDASPIERIEQVLEEAGVAINSAFLDGLDTDAAIQRIMGHLEQQGWGERVVSYRLRDWLISRQRYWGAPIPIVYDPEGNRHAIPDEHLPWVLPTDVEFTPKGVSPLAQSKELAERTERIFGKGWRPEIDTMDTFVCSSFYSYRYLAEGSREEFVPREVESRWMPVDMYIGGAEHACGHLIYARFMSMVLYDAGIVAHPEPYQRLVHQGTITNRGAKMSKSRKNVVSPDGYVQDYGSDVFRLYLMFMGPFSEGGDWSDSGIKGLARFVRRVYDLFGDPQKVSSSREDGNLTRLLHQTIKKVSEDTDRLHFNTAISALMTFLNEAESAGSVTRDVAVAYVQLLAPFAPHLAEEIWHTGLGAETSVFHSSWPSYDADLATEDEIEMPIQVNGKLRDRIKVPRTISREDLEKAALAADGVKRTLSGGITAKRVVIVPGRVVNVIAS